ncbi:MAG TPA: MscL family protein [Solirubrobacterales bacterium]|jgi:large conductance mechanosensitive channel
MLRNTIAGFKEFMLKGDLITVAVGLVMALATFALVEALVEDLITPIVAAIIGEPSFGDLSFTINGSEFLYGAFINALIVFVSTAAAVYFFVVIPYKAYQDKRGVSAKTRPCPECTTAISVAAKRCPACTATVLPDGV